MMETFVVLLRGINVGGKNILPMSDVKNCLVKLQFTSVSTYIASGNILLKSDKPVDVIKNQIETALVENFTLDSELIKVLVVSHDQLKAIVKNKPIGFGEQPEKYHSDAIFLIDIDASTALTAFNPREGVDMLWLGNGVIYSQRLSSERGKSRLNRIMSSPLYKSMTIRNWNTTTRLLSLLSQEKEY